MPATANIRKVSLVMVIIIGMVAVLLPLCMMAECGMSASEMLTAPGFGFSKACVTNMTSSAQAAIEAGTQQSLILTLVAALGVALVVMFPPLTMRPLRAVAEDPPTPPADPRGARLII